MPDRYHIHALPTPARFRRVGKFGNIDWREDCSRCSNCVKLRCTYDVYREESAHNRDPAAPVEIGHRSASLCHLGNIAIRLKAKLKWDPKAERFIGDKCDSANAMLNRESHEAWKT